MSQGERQALLMTSTGRLVDVLRLDSHSDQAIAVEDIVHALSHLCRYGGHTSKFYSVAEHSVWVSHMVPIEHAMWGLMHDASEAYLCDLPAPIKSLLPNYGLLEEKIQKVIARRFGLCWPIPIEVREADVRIRADEMAVLFRRRGSPQPRPHYPIQGMAPRTARLHFHARFEELRKMQARRDRNAFHAAQGVARD